MSLNNIGQEVYVVSKKNIRFNIAEGVSMQLGKIVACSNNKGNNEFLIQILNPSSNYVGLTNNQNQIWVNEKQFGPDGGGGNNESYVFTSLKEASIFYQKLIGL